MNLLGPAISSILPAIASKIGGLFGGATETIGQKASEAAGTIGSRAVSGVRNRFGEAAGEMAQQFRDKLGEGLRGGMAKNFCGQERDRINQLEQQIRDMRQNTGSRNRNRQEQYQAPPMKKQRMAYERPPPQYRPPPMEEEEEDYGDQGFSGNMFGEQ